MAQKRPKLVQNMHFWSFWAKYCHFLHILSHARPKTNTNKVPRWGFRYVGIKLLISRVKIRIFCPKTSKFGPKLAFLVNLGQAMQAYSVPCWWAGWWLWRAGCISQDTYLLYVIYPELWTFAGRGIYSRIHDKSSGIAFVFVNTCLVTCHISTGLPNES